MIYKCAGCQKVRPVTQMPLNSPVFFYFCKKCLQSAIDDIDNTHQLPPTHVVDGAPFGYSQSVIDGSLKPHTTP